MNNQIAVDVWGDFACFARPECKVERLTYPVPTPSAVRGILSAIYSKPKEFYWQINRIEVLNPIRYVSFKRNEVKSKFSKTPILVEEDRTQRQTVALQDVYYRIYATIVKQPDFSGSQEALYQQALRRIQSGKCFYQPSFGLREFVAYFEEAAGPATPIALDLDLGYMLYDVFDLHSYAITKKANPYITLFHGFLKQGVLEIPDFDSPQVMRPEVK